MQNYREWIYFYLLAVAECSREDVACAGIPLLLCSALVGVFVLWAPSPTYLAAVFCCADLPKPVDVREARGPSSSLWLWAALTKCLVQLLFVNAELPPWEEQCRRLREGLWLMASSWPELYSYNRDHRILMCAGFFYSLPLPHPLAQIDRKKMDWSDIHPIWGGISSLALNFDICLKQSAHEKQPVTVSMHKLQRKHPDKGRKHSHGFSASCRGHCLQPFCSLLTLKKLFFELLISMSHLITVFHEENVCPELVLTAVPGASL